MVVVRMGVEGVIHVIDAQIVQQGLNEHQAVVRVSAVDEHALTVVGEKYRVARAVGVDEVYL